MKKIWFYLLMLIFFAMGLMSCQKSALSPQHYKSFVQTWVVQEGHDRSTWNGAQFCNKEDYGKIDTIDLYYTDAPNDPNKFGYVPESIYFHIPGGRIPTEIPDVYDRYYAKLLYETKR